MYSDMRFQPLWMDWKYQKHGLALWSMRTAWVPYNITYLLMPLYFVLYNLVDRGARMLLTSSPATNHLTKWWVLSALLPPHCPVWNQQHLSF